MGAPSELLCPLALLTTVPSAHASSKETNTAGTLSRLLQFFKLSSRTLQVSMTPSFSWKEWTASHGASPSSLCLSSFLSWKLKRQFADISRAWVQIQTISNLTTPLMIKLKHQRRKDFFQKVSKYSRPHPNRKTNKF